MVELAAQVMPYVTAAAGVYGTAVLSKVEDEAADATVSLGRRVLQRVFGTRPGGGPLPEPVAEMAADPGDGDAVAALRLAIRKAVAADPLLASDLAGMLAGAGAGSMAGGDRSIAAQSVSGIAVTGDGATIVQR